MTGLGIIGTAAAYANYRSAKAEYEALKEQQDGLIAAVQTYNSSKYDEYINRQDSDPVDFMPGVKMTTILRVGNLVGKFFRVQASVVLSNTSDTTYRINSVAADCKVLGRTVSVFEFMIPTPKRREQQKAVNKSLAPGETMEINLPSGISALYNEKEENINGELRDLICEAACKKLITSCPKISIEGGETANIRVDWGDDKVALSRGVKGILRYCMEAFYPKD